MRERIYQNAIRYGHGLIIFWKREPGGWTQCHGWRVPYFSERRDGMYMMYLPRSAFKEFRLFGMWIAMRR